MPRRRDRGSTCSGKKSIDVPPTPTTVSASRIPWGDLPDECWAVIFVRRYKYPERAAISLVCKRFKSITDHLQTDLVLTPSSTLHTNRLYSRFPNLHSIHLGHPHPSLDDFIRQLAESNVLLKSFRLSHQRKFPRKAMRQLGRSCVEKTLKTLNCTDFKRLVDDDLFIVAKHFSYLHRLQLNAQPPTDHKEDVYKLSDEGIKAIAKSLTSLASFTFECFSIVTPHSFQYLSSSCPSLSHLALYCCTIQERTKIQCFSIFPSLTSLDLTSVGISDIGLEVLTMANLKLAKLVLKDPKCKNVTGTAICRFLKSCPSLYFLRMRGFKLSLDKDLAGLDFAASIPNVQEIFFSNCKLLQKNLLCNLLQKCPYLCEAYFSDICVGTLKESISAGVRNSMRRLIIGHCPDLSNETLADIGIVCPYLEKFLSIECPLISVEGAEAIMANCRYLNHISVQGGHSGFKLDKEL